MQPLIQAATVLIYQLAIDKLARGIIRPVVPITGNQYTTGNQLSLCKVRQIRSYQCIGRKATICFGCIKACQVNTYDTMTSCTAACPCKNLLTLQGKQIGWSYVLAVARYSTRR